MSRGVYLGSLCWVVLGALGAAGCLVEQKAAGGGAAAADGAVAKPGYEAPTSVAGAEYKWRSVKTLGGGFVTGVIMSNAEKGLAYARTDVGGAYRWNPKDKSWVPITDWIGKQDEGLLGVESIALDPTDPNKVYLALGTYAQSWAPTGAMVRSKDRGASFEITKMPIKMGGNDNARSNGERLSVDPNQPSILFFGSRRDGLWKSTDGSVTWAQVKSFPVPDDAKTDGFGVVFTVFDPKSGTPKNPTKTLYAGVANRKTGLWRSTDAGQSWAPVAGQPNGVMPSHGQFDSAGTLYLSYGSDPGPHSVTTGSVWKLDPKGAWTNITPLAPSEKDKFGYGGLSVYAASPGTLMVTTITRWTMGDDIFRTTDGGKTWKAIRAKAKHDIQGAKYLYWGRPNELSFSGWMGDIDIDPFDPAQAFYVTGQGIWRSGNANEADSDKPTQWFFENNNLEELVVSDLASPPSGPPLLSAVGDLGGFRHDDLEKAPERGMFENPIMGWGSSIDFAQQKPEVVVRVGHSDKGRRGALSTDGGATWKEFAAEPAECKGKGNVAISADGSTILWAARGAVPSISTDRAASWKVAKGLPPYNDKVPDWAPYSVKVAADRANPKKFYAVDGLSGLFYVSTDGGANFKSSMVGIPSLPDYQLRFSYLRTTPGFDGDLWVSAGKGLFHTDDSGFTFKRIGALEEATSVGLGKPAPGSNYPAVYVIGKVAGKDGFFRSDDRGESWIRINDDKHQFGGGSLIIGDPRVYGRAYVGTGGRGILYGEPK